MPPILELKDLRKSYYGNQVLKGISFSLMPGEIRGIIGENGAGKSTMMNIIFGMPVIHHTGGFEGEVLHDGKPAEVKSPIDAMNKGIGMVHQEFMLIPELSIFENIKLNREITKRYFFNKLTGRKLEFLDIKKMRADARQALKRVGLTIDEWLPVAGLPVSHMQFIEIAREVDHKNLNLLVFDEPTAVLTEVESKRLLATMKYLAKELGIAILFISHRLSEIEDVCDTITILRDGEQVGNYQKGEIDAPRMAELMVGRKISIDIKSPRRPKNGGEEPVLELKNFRVAMPGEEVNGIDLKVSRREILGIGGLAGQGKLGIANGIAGLFPAGGRLIKEGNEIPLNNPLASLKSGISFLSEDRRGTGLLLDDSIEHNICLTAAFVKGRFLHGGWLKPLRLADGKAIRAYAGQMIRELDIRCRSALQHTRRLSGGNQQKVCIARVMATRPDILLVSEPTRGVDIGAKKLILDKLIELNERGMTIIVTSSELLELKAVADRIVIISGGKMAKELSPKAPDREFGLAMAK